MNEAVNRRLKFVNNRDQRLRNEARFQADWNNPNDPMWDLYFKYDEHVRSWEGKR